MGIERRPETALLVMGVLASSEAALALAESRTKDLYGVILRKTAPVSFEKFTCYYENEMGPGLLRSYWAFAEPVARGCLVEAKLATNRIEREMSVDGNRTVNLDPGLLTPESLVIATAKPYSHRIYLSKGIYAELAVMFRRGGGIDPLPWAYLDYRDPETLKFFSSVRKQVILS